jgi:hypothetical protein
MAGNDITPESVPLIMASLNAWINSEQWSKEGGKYIPAPAKWLREKRWLDKPKQAEPEYAEPERSSSGTNAYAQWVAPWEKVDAA